jgi:TolB protein
MTTKKISLNSVFKLVFVIILAHLLLTGCKKDSTSPEDQQNTIDWEGNYPSVNTAYQDSILFTSDRYIGTHLSPSIYISSINGTGIRSLTNQYFSINPSWSPRRWRILYTAATDYTSKILKSSLFVMNADGTNQKRITNAGEQVTSKAAWSPDGNTIAYIENDTTYQYSRGRIKFINPDGKNPRVLTDWITSLTTVTWSPGSNALVFDGLSKDGQQRIFRINANGTNFAPLNLGEVCINPSISPDGKLLAFSKIFNGFIQLFVHTFSTQETKQITKEDRNNSSPSWSPDSKYIIYSSSTIGGKSSAIKKIKYDGTEDKFITDDTKYDNNPAWYN